MNIIVCVDDKNGMLFNNRRQSSDVLLREKIFELVGENKLYMNEYSKRQFVESNDNIISSNSFLDIAGKNDFCFIENSDFNNYMPVIESILIFRWNRVYPSDVKFDTELLKDFEYVNKSEFKGFSHDKITLEVYNRDKI